MKDRQINLGSYSLFSTLKSIGLLIAFLIMLYMYLEERGSRIEQEDLIEASNHEIEKWKNKDGENLAKIQVLETEKKETFLNFKTQDTLIRNLQKLVKQNRNILKNRGSAGVIKTETSIDNTTDTKVSKDENNNIVYESSAKNDWYKYDIKATKDSTKMDLKTYHNLSLVIGDEYQGLFKKRKPYGIAKDENPHSDIKDMRIYNIQKKSKPFVIGPSLGVGLDGKPNLSLSLTYKAYEFNF